jgi:hypothetical protein
MAEITYSIETVERMLREHGDKAIAEERARWLPLWEAVKEIEHFDDFNGTDDWFEYSPEYNAARENLHRAIQNLKNEVKE